MQDREELRRFLKAARARITPADVGLPPGERRRTRGLRREELASLAGMSVTWYTWFEQGRDVQLSAPMLERLCATLKLSAEEREFLFTLAQHRPAPIKAFIDMEVGASVQRTLDTVGIPALVMALDWTVIGWNRLYTRIFRDYGTMSPEERNLLKILLLTPHEQQADDNFLAMARQLIARFKWDYSRARDEGTFEDTIAELKERSAIFAEYWQRSDVTAHLEWVHTAAVPQIGPIRFHHTSYAVEQSPSQRLVLFAPEDEESAARLDQLARRAEVPA